MPSEAYEVELVDRAFSCLLGLRKSVYEHTIAILDLLASNLANSSRYFRSRLKDGALQVARVEALCLPSATARGIMSACCDSPRHYVCQVRRFGGRTGPKSSQLADISRGRVAIGRHKPRQHV